MKKISDTQKAKLALIRLRARVPNNQIGYWADLGDANISIPRRQYIIERLSTTNPSLAPELQTLVVPDIIEADPGY